MCETTDWDVEECLDETQPPNHWALKKAFIEKHKKKFPKYRLLALANTFTNIEFTGARYLPEVEKQISLLASEVPEIIEYRNGRGNFLQRTFVSASDASRSRCQRTNIEIPKTQTSFSLASSTDTQISSNQSIITPPVKSLAGYSLSNLSNDNLNLLQKIRSQKGIRGKIVIYFQDAVGAYQIVANSAVKAKLNAEIKRTDNTTIKTGQLEYMIKIDGEEVVKGYATGDKNAKEVLGPQALKILQEDCFTILVKTHLSGEVIDKSKLQEAKQNEPMYELPTDNVGAKLMRKMGWAGQGLGKHGSGIQKPVEVNRNISRMGLRLGNKDIKAIKDIVHKTLQDYAKSFDTYNLVFSNDYTNDERKIIHEMVQKLGLKSKSYGKNEKRQLVVCKKMDSWTIVAQLLTSGGENDNFKLLLPTKMTEKLKETNEINQEINKQNSSILETTKELFYVDKTKDENLLDIQDTQENQTNAEPNEELQNETQLQEILTAEIEEEKSNDDENSIGDETIQSALEYKDKNNLPLTKEERRLLRKERKATKRQALPKPKKEKKPQKSKKVKKLDDFEELRLKKKRKNKCIDIQVCLPPNERDFISRVRSQEGIYGHFIILHHYTQTIADYQLLLQSASQIGRSVQIAPTGLAQGASKEYAFTIGPEIICKEYFTDQKLIKNTLSLKARTALEERCFSIKIKTNKKGTLIRRRDVLGPKCTMPNAGHLQQPLSEQQTDVMKSAVFNIFTKYVNSINPDNIVFNTEFTEKERKSFSVLANKLHLKVTHYGKQSGRCMVVRKNIDYWDLVELLMSLGDETTVYKLIRPRNIF